VFAIGRVFGGPVILPKLPRCPRKPEAAVYRKSPKRKQLATIQTTLSKKHVMFVVFVAHQK